MKLLTLCICICFAAGVSTAQTSFPYYQNFDSATVTGWSHYATAGIDDWEYGFPAKSVLAGSRSGSTCAVTKASGDHSPNSVMYLETPEFDLTTASPGIHVLFWYRFFSSYATAVIEYSTNGGASWNVLNEPGSMKVDWPVVSMALVNWRKAAHNLDFLIGQVVKFRFVMSTSFSFSGGQGWAIDDFEIDNERFDLKALNQAGTFTDICKYTTQISVSPLVFRDYIYSTAPGYGTVSYYLSHDDVLDGMDVLYNTGTYTELTNILPLPVFPHAGDWYVLYALDQATIVAETNELNNTGSAKVKVDSAYYNVVIDFETDSTLYTKTVYPAVDTSLNGWKTKETHSSTEQYVFRGNKAVVNKIFNWTVVMHKYLNFNSFFDLSGETGQAMVCAWSKKQTISYSSSGTNARLNLQVSDLDYAPYFSTTSETGLLAIQLDSLYNNEWICGCKAIPVSPSIKFKKIRLNFKSMTGGSFGNSFISVDDIYLGTLANDLVIMEKKEYFSPSTEPAFTYLYKIWNAGLNSVAATNTSFYWSTDSILDVSDTYLGLNPELPFSAGADAGYHNSSYTFTKPTFAEGTYYLITKADADSTETEYNENNNVSFVKIHQHNVVAPPYFTDFESGANGWYSGTTLQADGIKYGYAPVLSVPEPFASTKLFYALPAEADSMSRMELYTPTFDLSGMNKPTIEFDLGKALNSYIGLPSDPHVNISYSTDNGYTWQLLDTSSLSFKGMYYKMSYQPVNGSDYMNGYVTNGALYANDFKNLAGNSWYQSRNCDENYHHVLEITPLNIYSAVKFRFNIGYKEWGGYHLPLLIDNFKVDEGFPDLEVTEQKTFYLTPSDSIYMMDFWVNNTGNHINENTQLSVYLSIDSILDVSDVLMHTQAIGSIRPHMKEYINFRIHLNETYPNGYFIYQLDEANLVAESNESNNTGAFKIIPNAIAPPYFDDFTNEAHNGWHPYVWDNITSQNIITNYRFINETAPAEFGYVDTAFRDMFFTNNYTPPSWIINKVVFLLETPPFDFLPSMAYEMSFKLNCFGAGFPLKQGGTLEMSVNGGVSWETIHDVAGTGMNWYSQYTPVETLNNKPGWYMFGGSTSLGPLMDTVQLNITHLGGLSNVRFRFAYCSTINPYGYSFSTGMRIDDFKITGTPTPTPCMAGVYTIGGMAPDFATFKDAVDAMINYGICGAVTFNIRPGIYHETINIPPFMTDAVKTITFQAENGDSSSVILEYDSAITLTIMAPYVTLNKLTVNSTFATASIYVEQWAHHLTIKNCQVNASGPTTMGCGSIDMWANNNFRIQHSRITADYFGIRVRTNAGYAAPYNGVVEHNRISVPPGRGISLEYVDTVRVTGNLITDSHHGILVSGSYGTVLIEKNNVNATSTGISCHYDTTAQWMKISNNFVNVTTTSALSGIYIDKAPYTEISHNTVCSATHYFNEAALYAWNEGHYKLRNNIFFNTGTGYAVTVNPGLSGLATFDMDYNIYFTNGPYVVQHYGAFATLADYTAWSGQETNGIETDPLLVSATDLHLAPLSSARNAATAVGITSDIDGEIRDALPDIGADEYLGPIGLAEYNLTDDLSVFPNPSTGTITILNHGDGQISKVLVYNELGVFVAELNLTANILDLRSLSNGVYLLMVNNKAARCVIAR